MAKKSQEVKKEEVKFEKIFDKGIPKITFKYGIIEAELTIFDNKISDINIRREMSYGGGFYSCVEDIEKSICILRHIVETYDALNFLYGGE